MDNIKLGYWKARGRAQISRLLLAYTQANWTDVQYSEQQKWFDEDKSSLQLPFPNLPYIIDGNFKLTESQAIQKYIIKRSDFRQLLGKDYHEESIIENIEGVLHDIRGAVVGQTMWGDPKTWEQKKPQIFNSIRSKMEQIKKFVGEKSFALDHITILDFKIQQFSYYVKKIFPEEYEKYEFLERIRKNFHELEKIKKYYEREDAIEGPFIAGQANLMF